MTLTERLQSLTADERFEMEPLLIGYDEAYILANWNLLVDELHYIMTL
jgi:hypothetical protein